MSVYDRWHKARLQSGEPTCREHKLAPTADHGLGDRWQVRWRDENDVQRKRNFARKTGVDPDKSADAFDAKVKTQLDDGSYVDPSEANTTLQAYAEDWRKNRTHDVVTAERVERELRRHVYPGPSTPGRTPTGAPAIGQRTMKELGKRPSLTQAWISGMKLGPGSANQVIRDVSSIFISAIDDGLLNRNPVQAKSVTRPKAEEEKKAQPWTLAEVDAMADALPARFAVLPYLGAGAGLRQGEMFGLAVEDIDFLRKVIHVQRQVRLAENVRCFAPVKNRKPHDVPLADSLAPVLAEHIRRYPPVEVTLPWKVPDGEPVTFTLLVTGRGGALHRTGFNKSHWRPAQKPAPARNGRPAREGIAPGRRAGCHVLRHTAASAWLSAGVDIVAVAAWLGDTVQTVWKTYAHMMPDTDDRGRKAMDRFFARASALNVPSGGAL